MRSVWSIVVVTLGVATVTVSATTRKVTEEYPGIQAAIEAAEDGDTVLVAPGVYYETINFAGKNILVTSTDPNDPKIVGYTIINAEEDGTVVTFENGEGPAAVLRGFTITGGVGTFSQVFTSQVSGARAFAGAGIYCDRASPTITKNVIIRNIGTFNVSDTQADIGFGGGISCYEGSPTITHNVIRNNSAWIGGGILCWMGKPTVHNNIISRNSSYEGGGVVMFSGSLYNNTIVENDAGLGDAIGMPTGPAGNLLLLIVEPGGSRVFNNIICNAPSGDGILWQGDLHDAFFAYNDVWNNVANNYSFVDLQTGGFIGGPEADQTGKAGNISVDPKFLNLFNNDYHLTLESPCVNAGDPASVPLPGEKDIDRQDRIYGARIDIGADEYIGYIKPVADAGFDRHVLEPLQAVTLDGSRSFFYDPCGITTFRWAQVSGASVTLDDPNAAGPVFTPPAGGEYIFQLVVADDRYSSEPDQVLVFVGANQPPVASARADGVWAMPGRVTLDGTGSHDPDPVDRLSYTWTQVAGPAVELYNAGTATPSFAVEVEGQYAFELVVSDGFESSTPSRVQGMAVRVTKSAQTINLATAEAGNVFLPDLSGARLVYATGNAGINDWRIACRDLLTSRVDTFTRGGISTQPKIDGDFLVWSGGAFFSANMNPECTSVFVRDLTTGAERTLRERSDTSSFGHPAVSGRKVVWVQHLGIDKNAPAEKWYNTAYDIGGADLSDFDQPVYFTVATNVGRRDPFLLADPINDSDNVVDLCGDLVVWEGNGNIYAADISNVNDIRVFTVCDHPARQYDPAVSGRYVVWTDERHDGGDIYGADLTEWTKIREFAVARARGIQCQPAIDDALVIYVEGSTTGGRLGLACLTRQHGVLTTDLPNLYFGGTMPLLDGTTLVWLGSAYGPAQAASLSLGYSVPDGPVQNGRTGQRYDYIQHAIADANDGDEIIVPEGLYEEKVNFSGKAVTVRSTDPNDAGIVAATILRSSGNVVTCAGREGAASVLAGLTITGGNQGLYCYNASPTISRCTITNNLRAGLFVFGQSNPVITFGRIVANGGAGIEMTGPTTGRGVKQGEATIHHCFIAANRAQGIHGGRPTVTNCTVVENLQAGISVFSATIVSSIIYGNDPGADEVQIDSSRATVTYSDVQGGWEGDGNIDADPCFAAWGRWINPADPTAALSPTNLTAIWEPGDYHLRSQGWRWDALQGSWVLDAVTSPCIDAGDPAAELLDEPRTAPGDPSGPVINQRVDMGAYGGTTEASLAPLTP